MMLLVISLLANVAFLMYIYFIWNFNHFRKRKIVGPEPTPLLGNFPSEVTRKKNIMEEMDQIYNEFKGTAPYIGVFHSRSPKLLILEPSLAKSILVGNFKSAHTNEFGSMINKEIDPILGRNPFFLDGQEWREKRAEITPAFTPARLKTMYPMMNDVATNNLISFIKNKASLGGVDVKKLTKCYTTDVVSSCIYGIDTKALTNEKSELSEMADKLLDFGFGFIIYFLAIAVFPWITKFYQKAFVPKDIEKYFTGLTRHAINLRKEKNVQRMDFLEYVLELQKKKNLSDLDMTAHTISFMMDGIHTSAYAISSALYLLAKNERVQQKLRDELNESVTNGASLTFENVSELPYLDQVFNESVRILPPFGANVKTCTETFSFEFEGKQYEIQKGDKLELPTYSMHRDDRFWENPTEYNPERFDAVNGGAKKFKDEGSFYPFGDGPRACLGMRFAITQSKLCIAEIVRNFKISFSNKMEKDFVMDPNDFMITARGGVWLNFDEIEKVSG